LTTVEIARDCLLFRLDPDGMAPDGEPVLSDKHVHGQKASGRECPSQPVRDMVPYMRKAATHIVEAAFEPETSRWDKFVSERIETRLRLPSEPAPWTPTDARIAGVALGPHLNTVTLTPPPV
jgi:hypothetical protein